MMSRRILLLAFLLILAACNDETDEAPSVQEETQSEEVEVAINLLTLTSAAFGEGESIPEKYTCDGEDVSPPLTWQDVSADVGAYALIMDDPDAPRGTWVHWVIYDLAPDLTQLPEGVASNVGTQGSNSWDRMGYGGPCPPSGTHRYFFKLYALDAPVGLEAGADKETLLSAIEGHVLAEGQLMGTYAR